MLRGRELVREISQTEPFRGQAAFWWLGQMGFALHIGGKVIYTDLYLKEEKVRMQPPILKGADITNAKLVLGTHDHADHIDDEAWKQIAAASPQAVFVAPAMLVERLSLRLGIPENRFFGIEDGESRTVEDVEITGIAGAHEFLDREERTGRFPYMAYVIKTGGVTVFHAGDTCIYEGFLTKIRGQGKIDIAILPINGRDALRYTTECAGNMTYQEAVDLAGAMEPGLVIPAHYEMHAHNSENPVLFAAYLKCKYPKVSAWIGGYGEKQIYVQERE